MTLPLPSLAIGVAGWSYPDWEGIVYERGVRDRLGALLRYVDMLEINRTRTTITRGASWSTPCS